MPTVMAKMSGPQLPPTTIAHDRDRCCCCCCRRCSSLGEVSIIALINFALFVALIVIVITPCCDFYCCCPSAHRQLAFCPQMQEPLQPLVHWQSCCCHLWLVTSLWLIVTSFYRPQRSFLIVAADIIIAITS